MSLYETSKFNLTTPEGDPFLSNHGEISAVVAQPASEAPKDMASVEGIIGIGGFVIVVAGMIAADWVSRNRSQK